MIDVIESMVCSTEKLDPKELHTRSRKGELVQTRQMIMYLQKNNSPDSLAKIGRYYNLDHATVLHSINTVKNTIDIDRHYADKIKLYQSKIDKVKEISNHLSMANSLINGLNEKIDKLREDLISIEIVRDNILNLIKLIETK